MLELRSSEHAEREIRRLAVDIIRLLKNTSPIIFGDFEIYQDNAGIELAKIKYSKV